MNLIEPRIILSLKAGESPITKREFAWGTPVPPFSVGKGGDWAIAAAAVDERHLFLAFDGYRLHAAAASGAHDVTVDGVTLGGEWMHIAVPSLLAFGAASISIECEEVGRAVAAPVRPQPIIDLSRADRQTTRVMDLSSTLRLNTVRLEVPEKLLAQLREAPAPEGTPQQVTPQVAAAAWLQSGNTLTIQPAPVRTLTFTRPHHLDPQVRPGELVNTLYDGGALRERAAQLANGQAGAGLTPDAASAPPVSDQSLPAPKHTSGVLGRPLAAFRRSSVPKQLTIALLPLALAGLWAMKGGSASASGSAAVSAARAKAPPAASVVAKASDAPSPTSESPAANAPSTPGISNAPTTPGAANPAIKSPAAETSAQPHDPRERLALLAAFSGNKAEAAAIYDQLAATHNSRTFALAARLTRDDRVRKP